MDCFKTVILGKRKRLILLYWGLEIFLLLLSSCYDSKILHRWTGALFGIGALITYYFFIFYPGYSYIKNKRNIVISSNLILNLIFISLLSCLFVYFETKNAQTIYIWDSLEVWQPTLEVRNLISNDPLSAIKDIYHSINYNDYNKFVPLLLSIPFKLTGKEFYNFVISGWIILGIPATLNLAIAIFATENNIREYNLRFPYIYAMILLIGTYTIPLLIGYMNISIIATGSAIWLLFMQMDLNKIEIEKILYLSLLAIASVIQSRTAAYMVVGAFLGFFVQAIYRGYIEKRFNIYLKHILYSYAIIGVAASIFLLVFFHHFFIHALTYDIKIAYSAYAMGTDYLTRIIHPFKQLGLFVVLLLIPNVIIYKRCKQYRDKLIYLTVWLFSSVFLISRIQLMGINHIYIILIPVAGLIAFGFNFFYKNKYIILFTTGVLLLGFIQSFTQIIDKDLSRTYTPPCRYDINTIGMITNDLNQLTYDNKDKIYILASSGSYNQNTFNKYYFPDKIYSIPNALRTNDVDLRDGFPVQFFDAKYILVLVPIQTHLMPKDQSVVTELSKELLNDTSFSKHYKVIKNYELYRDKINNKNMKANKVTAYLYKKITPLTLDDIEYIQQKFDNLYPNQPELFKNRIDDYIRKNSEAYY